MSGILYLVATPIGNLGDLTARAAEVLAGVDFIAAEDTRTALKLLNHLGLKKPLVSYHAHNLSSSGQKIVERILAGESCALVSEAGMPAISDPGEDLVRLCAKSGIDVRVVPGPCAAVAALALSALPTGRFVFEGFLSTARKNRTERLAELASEKRTMVFYEAPHKLLKTLRDMLVYFGDRKISIVREMTKVHEEVVRCTLSEAVARFEQAPPRGEFVLVVEGAKGESPPEPCADDALSAVGRLLSGGVSLKDAVRKVSEETGVPRNDLYRSAVRLRDEQ